MDTITHTLFGLTTYGAVNKENMKKETKKALFFTTLVGSQIPDIDVISRMWDTQGMYQMWHRGITHSFFLIPVWAILIMGLCYLFWRVKDRRIFYIGLLSVFIHNTIDLFNAWGTGYFEPFSSIRITFGTIPIVDLTIWMIILLGFVMTRINKKAWFRKYPSHYVYKMVGLFILLHVTIQSVQGYMIYQSMEDRYEQHALSASFVPWHFTVIGKNGAQVELSNVTLWGEAELRQELTSSEEADLDVFFQQNPKAKTLYEWSPFVVIVDDEDRLGVYDPRFYREGQSFLFEYIDKK
jgi:inner membrane protein